MQVLSPSNTPFYKLSIHQSFLTALEAARYLIFFFVTQCKQIDICKFPYCVMQTLPVVFSTEVRYFMGGSGTLIADVHLSCSTTLEAQLRSSADFAWLVKLKAFILYGIR